MPQFTQEVEVARLDMESVDSQGHVLNYYAKLSPQGIVIRPETLDDLPMGRRFFLLYRGHKTLSCTFP